MRRLWRIGGVLALCVAAVLAMGASDPAARFQNIGNKLMCTCGCGQVMLQCNHIACPALGRQSEELSADIAKGMSNNAIFIAFQNEYGPTVLAAPMLTKFNMIAWIMPPLVLALGILGIFILVRRWRRRMKPSPEAGPEFAALREKIRKETEL